MYPDAANLQPERVRRKILEGRSAEQVAVWFASDSIAHVLSTYTIEQLNVLMKELEINCILEIEEKSKIITFIRNNEKDKALDKLCTYLSRKSCKDVKQFQVMLQTRFPTFADYLNTVISRCEEITRQEDKPKRSDARKLNNFCPTCFLKELQYSKCNTGHWSKSNRNMSACKYC